MNSIGIKQKIISNKYLTRHKYRHSDDQYRKFQQYFDSFGYMSVNDPTVIFLKIHELFIDCLKNNYHIDTLSTTNDITSFVKNEKLHLFVLSPKKWLNSFYGEYTNYFTNKNDKDEIKIGLALLSPKIRILEAQIFQELGIVHIGEPWSDLTDHIKRLKNKRIIRKFRKIGFYFIIIVIILYLFENWF